MKFKKQNKKFIWFCWNDNGLLCGDIEFTMFGNYYFNPRAGVCFSEDELQNIANFIIKLKKGDW